MSAYNPATPSAAGAARESVDVLAVFDDELRVTVWTGAAERLWGRPADKALHRPAEDFLAPYDAAPPEAFGSGPWSGRVRIMRGDGDEVSADLRTSPLGNGGGRGWLLWGPDPVGLPGTDPEALDALFGHSPVSLAVWDPDLCCIWFNHSVHDQDIYRAEPELGGYVTDLIDARHPGFLVCAMKQVLERGEPLIGHELWPSMATATRPTDHHYQLTLVRLDGPDGRPLGVCSVAVRVNGARERGRLHLLSEAESRIGTELDPMVTSQELAETAVPTLADYVTIDLVEAVPLGSEPLGHLRATDTSIPGFYRAGLASVHADRRESLWPRGTPVFVPPASPFTAVLETRRSHFEPDLDTSPGTWLDNDPDRASVIHSTGMHSLMIVPLQARGSMLGIAVFVRSVNAIPFSGADLVLAEELAARAALSLDNALRYTRERTAALAMQRDLMPHHLTGGSTLDVASRYLPADTNAGVGGDWFDVVPLADGRIALVVGDVTGHGINAAVTMGRLRTMVRTLTKLEVPPARLLTLMDELATEIIRERFGDDFSSPSTVGATCLYVVYDPAARRCTMASAGHPPPAIVSPDGSVGFADVPPGTPIGMGLGTFESVEVDLAEGSVIALYTDGLIECRDDDLGEGMERLRRALERPVPVLDDVCASVVGAMAPNGPVDDDIALLLARTRPPAA